MTEATYITIIAAQFSAAVGAFMSGKIMLTSTHREQIAEERQRTADEKHRADRLMEVVMRAVGASEELTKIVRIRDVERDARDARERPPR